MLFRSVDTKVAVWKTADPGPMGGRPVRYLSIGTGGEPAASSFTAEDTWQPAPKPEAAKPNKSGGKKPMTREDWDEMYPVSEGFRKFGRVQPSDET